jgi:ligand-binding SRPBCC domain-containing protein
MAIIYLTTYINAPIEKVFDLARSIDMHQQSMQHTNEKAVGGRLSGLIETGETVTWEATHFFRKRRLTSKIVTMNAPRYFRDEMVNGDFTLMHHDHHFQPSGAGTEMKDVFIYKAPYAVLGRIIEVLFLNRYLKRLLQQRNMVIKRQAEAS